MGKCERCGVELEISGAETSAEFVPAGGEVMHTADRCADRLKTQRDEALARAELYKTSLDNVERAYTALRAEFARKMEALEWYADPANNGKREWHTIDGVDVGKHRWIDDDEGEVARAALADSPKAGGPACKHCGWRPSDTRNGSHAFDCPDFSPGTPPREPDPVERAMSFQKRWNLPEWIVRHLAASYNSVHNAAVEECALKVDGIPLTPRLRLLKR